MRNQELETIIGLEIHVQLKTKSKMFCACSTDNENAEQNTNICPVCFGMLGALPLINKKAVEWSVRSGLAFGCEVASHTKWDRKNYFYPDIPKGYQISQYDVPITEKGLVEIMLGEGKPKKVGITRLHLEEDTGKTIHEGEYSLVDYNRSGIPLMEIVTEPDIRSPEEAKKVLEEVRRVIRYIGVSDVDMEKGQLRVDASISVRPHGETKLYPRSEIKNLNSFRSVERALVYEEEKKRNLWAKGEYNTEQETVLWDEDKQKTVFMRDKEGEADYRYFPEPDIPEVWLSKETIGKIKESIVELPGSRVARYVGMGVGAIEATSIAETLAVSEYFDELIAFAKSDADFIKASVKWFIGDFFSCIAQSKDGVESIKLTPTDFFKIIETVERGTVSRVAARGLLAKACEEDADVATALDKLAKDKESFDVVPIIQKVFDENTKVVEAYKGGKVEAMNVLVGLVVKETKGAVPAPEVVVSVKKALSNSD